MLGTYHHMLYIFPERHFSSRETQSLISVLEISNCFLQCHQAEIRAQVCSAAILRTTVQYKLCNAATKMSSAEPKNELRRNQNSPSPHAELSNATPKVKLRRN